MVAIRETKDGLAFTVYVQPRSSKIAIVGRHQDALKIKLTAPPVGGAANKQCIQVLAKALGLPKSTIHIFAGKTSRRKQIRIQAINGVGPAAGLSAIKEILIQLSSKTS